MRLPQPREQQAHDSVYVRDRPNRGVRTAAESLLVDDHRHAEVLDGVRFGLGVAREERANKEAEVLVKLALRLRRDRVEHDRRLSGARHAGEDRDHPFGDPQGYVLEVVLAGPADLDVLGHRSSVGKRGLARLQYVDADGTSIASGLSDARRFVLARLDRKS